MKRFVRANRDQQVLYERTIADALKPNHEVFAFANLIDSLDLSAFLAEYSPEGGRAYDPRLMVGVLVYGYHRGWRSSRALQRACEENTAMRYLVGNEQIKFRAIAEFRVKFATQIDGLFKQSVAKVIVERPTVGSDVKVDGTKIKANAANDQTYTREVLEARKVKLEKKIDDYLSGGIEDDKREDAELGENESRQVVDGAATQSRIQKFIEEQKRAARTRAAEKPKVNADEKVARPSNSPQNADPKQAEMFAAALHLQKVAAALKNSDSTDVDAKVNLTDSDARFMKNRGRLLQSYNVQVASSEGFIIDADIAINNAENDLKELHTVLARVQSNIDKAIQTSTTDAGYFHANALEFLVENNIDGYIPAPQQVALERKNLADTGFESHHFRHEEKSNILVCPQNKPLSFHREFERDGNRYFAFHGKSLHCVPCPLREACCATKEDLARGFRSVELGEAHALKRAMILKMKTDEAKKIYRKRGAEIEPIFGTWKAARGFWYFLLRGTKKARTEVKLTAIAFNFGKLVRLAAA